MGTRGTKDVSSLDALHFGVQTVAIITGLVLGFQLRSDMAVTIAIITVFLTTYIIDIRLLTFSSINSTYGEVVNVKDGKDGRKVIVAYSRFAKGSTQAEVDSDTIVFIKHKEKLKQGEKVLVEYQRGREWIAVAGPFGIVTEILANISNAFMLSHFLVLIIGLLT